MGNDKDKLVMLLKKHYGTQGNAAKCLNLTAMTVTRIIHRRDQRRNLLKYLPELHKHTQLTVQELYDIIIN